MLLQRQALHYSAQLAVSSLLHPQAFAHVAEIVQTGSATHCSRTPEQPVPAAVVQQMHEELPAPAVANTTLRQHTEGNDTTFGLEEFAYSVENSGHHS